MKGAVMDLKKGVIPVSELKNRMKQILDQVVKTGEPVLVTQKGHSVVVILDVDVFQQQQRKLGLLEKIAKGEREILEGKGMTHAEVMQRSKNWQA